MDAAIRPAATEAGAELPYPAAGSILGATDSN